MNDIIILGNGFDLAHGLATGYKDYVRAMLIDSLLSKIYDSWNKNVMDDPNDQIEPEAKDYTPTYDHSPFRIEGTPNLLPSYLPDPKKYEESFAQGGLIDTYERATKLCEYTPSTFIKCILKDFENKGWHDLGQAYSNLLREMVSEGGINKTGIIALNKQMKELEESLYQYLYTIAPPKPILGIHDLFQRIKKERIEGIEKLFRQGSKGLGDTEAEADAGSSVNNLSGITVVTFNYTDTCEQLYKEALTIKADDVPAFLKSYLVDEIPPTFIHIYGSLKEKNTVLNYAGDMTETFQKLEGADENELTKYIKSFYYLQDSRYRQLCQLRDRGPFRLYLIGSSLAQSDHKLLSIFDHSNCIDKREYCLDNKHKR